VLTVIDKLLDAPMQAFQPGRDESQGGSIAGRQGS
jgi:hypothetical protein